MASLSGNYNIRIKEFQIRVRDFDRARVFYTEALGFELWPDDEFLPTDADFQIFFDDGELYTVPPGYLMNNEKSDTASLFIAKTRELEGYPRALFTTDLNDTIKRVLSAGGEVYRPTRFRRRGSDAMIEPETYQTFFQDTEGNVTELCSTVDNVPEHKNFSFVTHISDSFSSDISID